MGVTISPLGPLAQQGEQLTLNQQVQGSSPWRLTFKPQLLNQAVAFLELTESRFLEVVRLFWCRRYIHLLGVFFHHASGAEQRRVRADGFFDYMYPAVWYAIYVSVIVERNYFLL